MACDYEQEECGMKLCLDMRCEYYIRYWCHCLSTSACEILSPVSFLVVEENAQLGCYKKKKSIEIIKVVIAIQILFFYYFIFS